LISCKILPNLFDTLDLHFPRGDLSYDFDRHPLGPGDEGAVYRVGGYPTYDSEGRPFVLINFPKRRSRKLIAFLIELIEFAVGKYAQTALPTILYQRAILAVSRRAFLGMAFLGAALGACFIDQAASQRRFISLRRTLGDQQAHHDCERNRCK
jgi:hypothetical protein